MNQIHLASLSIIQISESIAGLFILGICIGPLPMLDSQSVICSVFSKTNPKIGLQLLLGYRIRTNKYFDRIQMFYWRCRYGILIYNKQFFQHPCGDT